jgi:hypothetical protein
MRRRARRQWPERPELAPDYARGEMAERALVDLRDAEVVDDHCHGFRLDEVLARDVEGFEARLTLMGMCLMSSAQTSPRAWALAKDQVGSTVFSLVARRWLDERLV